MWENFLLILTNSTHLSTVNCQQGKEYAVTSVQCSLCRNVSLLLDGDGQKISRYTTHHLKVFFQNICACFIKMFLCFTGKHQSISFLRKQFFQFICNLATQNFSVLRARNLTANIKYFWSIANYTLLNCSIITLSWHTRNNKVVTKLFSSWYRSCTRGSSLWNNLVKRVNSFALEIIKCSSALMKGFFNKVIMFLKASVLLSWDRFCGTNLKKYFWTAGYCSKRRDAALPIVNHLVARES